MIAHNLLITGASGGIGAALARVYALPGSRLVLWGRSEERLAESAARCRARGAICETASFDLTDFDRLAAAIEAADAQNPFDLAILNAGIGGSLPRARVAQDALHARAMAEVNFTAPVVAANLVAQHMARRGRGRIVFVGSVAGSFPLPMAPVYSGTKAGLAMFAEALGLRLAPYGVGVTLVSPGFIDTAMSRGLSGAKPFLMPPDAAAAIIARKIERGAREVVVPWQFAVVRAAARLLPRPIMRAVLSRLLQTSPD